MNNISPRYKTEMKYISRSETAESLNASMIQRMFSSVSSGSRLRGDEARDQICLVRTNLVDRKVEEVRTGVTQEQVYRFINGNASPQEVMLVRNLLESATGEDMSEVDEETLKLASNFLLKTENVEALKDIFQEPDPQSILEAFGTYKLWSMDREVILAIISYEDPVAILKLLGENNELLKLRSETNVQVWAKMLETFINNPDLIFLGSKVQGAILKHSSDPISIFELLAKKPQLMRLDLEVLIKILEEDKEDSSAILVLNHIAENPRSLDLKLHILKDAIDAWKPDLKRKFLDSVWRSELGQRILMKYGGRSEQAQVQPNEFLKFMEEHSLELSDKERQYAEKFLLKTNNKETLLSVLQNPNPLSVLTVIVDSPNTIDPRVILTICDSCLDPARILDLLCKNPVLLELNLPLLTQIAQFDQSEKAGASAESILLFLLKNPYFIKGNQLVLEKILASMNPMKLLHELLSIKFINLSIKLIDIILKSGYVINYLVELQDNFKILKLDEDFLVEVLNNANGLSMLELLAQERPGQDAKRRFLGLFSGNDVSAVSEKGIDICYEYLFRLKNSSAVKLLLSKNDQNEILIDKLLSYGNFIHVIKNERNIDVINKFLSSELFIKILSMPMQKVQEILYGLSENPILYTLDLNVLELVINHKGSGMGLFQALAKSGLLQETGILTRVLKSDNPVKVIDALRGASPEQRQQILESLPQ